MQPGTPIAGRLSAGGLILHRGEGLALWGTTGLEEAAKDGSYSRLSQLRPQLKREGAGGGQERKEVRGKKL